MKYCQTRQEKRNLATATRCRIHWGKGKPLRRWGLESK